ncbi:unnamed protein product [Meganyctiphanes norvegica]|uniref:Uncharacterized protein n=1 Tax=Meganyctiphanes norvegica TaxID=48144 RepID=A0AAV2SWQ3_MEGNR
MPVGTYSYSSQLGTNSVDQQQPVETTRTTARGRVVPGGPTDIASYLPAEDTPEVQEAKEKFFDAFKQQTDLINEVREDGLWSAQPYADYYEDFEDAGQAEQEYEYEEEEGDGGEEDEDEEDEDEEDEEDSDEEDDDESDSSSSSEEDSDEEDSDEEDEDEEEEDEDEEDEEDEEGDEDEEDDDEEDSDEEDSSSSSSSLRKTTMMTLHHHRHHHPLLQKRMVILHFCQCRLSRPFSPNKLPIPQKLKLPRENSLTNIKLS